MVLDPNANWTAAIAKPNQVPVYAVRFDGLSKQYSTGPISGATVTTLVFMAGPPKGGGGSVNLIDGRTEVGSIKVELLDRDNGITSLLASTQAGSPLATMKNRKVTLLGGYAELDESDYATIGVYRVAGVKFNRAGTGYEFDLVEPLYLLDGDIMVDATSTTPATIRGNVVNLLMSILRGVFSTSDADFPLDEVSTATGSSSAPTGLGIADAVFDFTQIKAERDAWRFDDAGKVVFTEPEQGREHVESEFFRNLQARPIVTGAGLIGIKFNTPALPASAAPVVDLADTVELNGWRQLFDDHLNKFTIRGDYDHVDDEYDTDLYATETSEDTTDQSNTGETVEYLVESRWLRTEYNGVEIAEELAGRMRLTWLDIPSVVSLSLLFSKRNLEPGDVVALTHPDVPDLRTATRGVTGRLMSVLRMGADFRRGRITVDLLDLGYRRYGVVAPNSVTGDYLTASEQDRATFAFIADDADDEMSNGDDGYRLI